MNLLEVQRAFRGWLTQESDEAAQRLGAAAAPGLAVYLNTYRGQLMACLSETFGAVRIWLGDTAFEAAAAEHIDRVPPSSWTLDDYAQDFPDTLRTVYPDDPQVFDLACLQRALAAIYTAADSAPLRPESVDPEAWAGIDWDRAVLQFVPARALLPVTTNAAAIWSAIATDGQPPAAAVLDAPVQLLIWRKGHVPIHRSLEPDEAEALQRLAEGVTFGALCASLIERRGEAEAPPLAAAWLGQWLRDGLIARIL